MQKTNYKKKQNMSFNKKNRFKPLSRLIFVGVSFALVAIMFFGITGAWFFLSRTTQNITTIGNVQIQATPIENPFVYTGQLEQDVFVQVQNLSNVHVVVRAYVNISWQNDYDLGQVNLILDSGDWTPSLNSYFYYNKVLKPSGQNPSSASFLKGVELLEQEDKKLDKTFFVNVFFEAVQYANNAYSNVWLKAPHEWLNLIGGSI